jgi:hypothetical protein
MGGCGKEMEESGRKRGSSMSKNHELNHKGALSAWELHCQQQARRHRMREIRNAAGIILASLATAAIVSMAVFYFNSIGWL